MVCMYTLLPYLVLQPLPPGGWPYLPSQLATEIADRPLKISIVLQCVQEYKLCIYRDTAKYCGIHLHSKQVLKPYLHHLNFVEHILKWNLHKSHLNTIELSKGHFLVLNTNALSCKHIIKPLNVTKQTNQGLITHSLMRENLLNRRNDMRSE